MESLKPIKKKYACQQRSKTVAELIEDIEEIKKIALNISELKDSKSFWNKINPSFERICFKDFKLIDILSIDKAAVNWKRFMKPIWKQVKKELNYVR